MAGCGYAVSQAAAADRNSVWLGSRQKWRASPIRVAPSGNATAADNFKKNVFSVTRQVRYSSDSGNELDMVIFINGLPVLTFELKNSLTKQTVADAITQWLPGTMHGCNRQL